MMKCLKCFHEWVPNVKTPKKCPKCNSPNWDIPQRETVKCLRCGYQWKPFHANPRACPNCDRENWKDEIYIKLTGHYVRTPETIKRNSLVQVGANNSMWKGDLAQVKSGQCRARSYFKLKPCEVCGSAKSERHHKDGNDLNNNPENIMFVCRRHHMLTDGRMKNLIPFVKGHRSTRTDEHGKPKRQHPSNVKK